MKKQDGKTSFQLILTITISLIIAGVSVAMIFGGTDIASEIKALINKDNKNTDTVQTDEKISYLTTGIY